MISKQLPKLNKISNFLVVKSEIQLKTSQDKKQKELSVLAFKTINFTMLVLIVTRSKEKEIKKNLFHLLQ